jgi:hypothetical protein
MYISRQILLFATKTNIRLPKKEPKKWPSEKYVCVAMSRNSIIVGYVKDVAQRWLHGRLGRYLDFPLFLQA